MTDWNAIGTIGALVEAAAVVISLIYIAIQTTLTRKAAQETSEHSAQSATHAAVGMYSDWRRTLLSTPELASILVRAREPEQLSDEDKILFSICFEDLFFAATTSYRSVVHNTAGYTESIGVMHMVAVLGENPRAIDEWRKMSPILSGISKEFVEAVDRSLANRNAA